MYLRVMDNGDLHITCPRRVSKAQILAVIREKEGWIRKTEEKENRRQEHTLCGEDGKTACWLGRRLPVIIEKGNECIMIAEEDCIRFIIPDSSPDTIRSVFYEAAAQQLRIMITDRRNEWDEAICRANGKPLPKITLRWMTSRWGSCTPAKASIRISLRLIHYPPVCLDYVLLHEYAHMLIGDHSRRFYALIGTHMPEYREAVRILREQR